MTPRERYLALLVDHDLTEGEEGESNADQWTDADHPAPWSDGHGGTTVDTVEHFFAMVESSRYGQTYITLHDSLQQACDTHLGNEYAEEWGIDELIDLRDGQRYRVETLMVPSPEDDSYPRYMPEEANT